MDSLLIIKSLSEDGSIYYKEPLRLYCKLLITWSTNIYVFKQVFILLVFKFPRQVFLIILLTIYKHKPLCYCFLWISYYLILINLGQLYLHNMKLILISKWCFKTLHIYLKTSMQKQWPSYEKSCSLAQLVVFQIHISEH